MKRREFMELSAAATVTIMAGNLLFSGNSPFNNVSSIKPSRTPLPRMYGGCCDHRMMDNLPPELFERELLGNWA